MENDGLPGDAAGSAAIDVTLRSWLGRPLIVNPEAKGLEGGLIPAPVSEGDLDELLKGIDKGDGECMLRSLEFDAGLRSEDDEGVGDEDAGTIGEEEREADDPRARSRGGGLSLFGILEIYRQSRPFDSLQDRKPNLR